MIAGAVFPQQAVGLSAQGKKPVHPTGLPGPLFCSLALGAVLLEIVVGSDTAKVAPYTRGPSWR